MLTHDTIRWIFYTFMVRVKPPKTPRDPAELSHFAGEREPNEGRVKLAPDELEDDVLGRWLETIPVVSLD